MSHVHNTWKCGHARRPYNGLSTAPTSELEVMVRRVTREPLRARIRAELKERRQSCPACRASDRRAFRQALLITLFAIVMLTVTCAAHGWSR